jgi:hypothetical protein
MFEQIANPQRLKALLRNPYWWIEVVGVALQIVAMFIMRMGAARLVVMALGLGLFLLGAKVLYDNLEWNIRKYELISRRDKPRIR